MSIEKKYIEDVLHPFIRPHNNQFSSKGRGRAGIIMMMDNDGKGILARIIMTMTCIMYTRFAMAFAPLARTPPLPDRPIAPPRRTTGHCRAIPVPPIARIPAPFHRHKKATSKGGWRYAGALLLCARRFHNVQIACGTITFHAPA